MKDQFFASAADLRAIMEATRKQVADNWQKDNIPQVLQMLSVAIRDLRVAGIDVSLEVTPEIHQECFDLTQKINGCNGVMNLSFSGVLRVNNSEFLLVHQAKQGQDRTPVSKVYISNRNYACRSLKQDFRGTVYNLKDDAEAINKFQKRIINIDAQDRLVQESDIHKVFENSKDKSPPTFRLNKPATKL